MKKMFCCLTCAHTEICPELKLHIEITENPMEVTHFYCARYLEVTQEQIDKILNVAIEKMNGLIVVDIASTESGEGAYLDARLDQTDVSPMPWPASRIIPPSIERGQAIYWSYAWRAGEQETRKALAKGQGKTFPNAQEAIRWLLSDDA